MVVRCKLPAALIAGCRRAWSSQGHGTADLHRCAGLGDVLALVGADAVAGVGRWTLGVDLPLDTFEGGVKAFAQVAEGGAFFDQAFEVCGAASSRIGCGGCVGV